jgi:hypothetical protein
MRHLLGELALTPARQSRHYFPKQGRGTTTGLGCRRCEPLLALSSKPPKFLADHHTQSICHMSRHGSNEDLKPGKNGANGTTLETCPCLGAHPRAACDAIS